MNNCEYSLLVKSEDAVYDMVEDLPATLTNASAKIVRVRSRDIRVGDILVLGKAKSRKKNVFCFFLFSSWSSIQ